MGYTFADFFAQISTEDKQSTPVEEAMDLDNTDTPEGEGTLLDDVPQTDDETNPNEDGEACEAGGDDATADSIDETAENTEGDESLLNDEGEPSTDDETQNDEANDESSKEDDVEAEGEPTVEEGEGDESDDDSDDDDDEEEGEKEPSEEEVKEAEEALEQLKEMVSNIATSGGLTESQSQLVQTSFEEITKSLKLNDARITPSIESFSESSSRRLLATNVVLNNINYHLTNLRG